jgi:ParB family chromosome partitioning protein
MTVIDKDRTASKAASKRQKLAKGRAAAGHAAEQPSEAVKDEGALAPASREDVLVPLDRLELSDANVRQVTGEQSLAELAALIEAQGLLNRLSVVALPDGHFAVVAGGRRLRAMRLLVEQGKWHASQPVECKVHDPALALQVSLAENSGREPMHPADQMEAFRRLVEHGGLSVTQVAGRFGVSALTVERRLRLARLAPRFIAMYRANEIEPDQLQALALTEDHAAQQAVWESLPSYDRSAYRIRQAIMAEACCADSKLARFVGLDAYEAAGGTVRRDLFASTEDLCSIFLDNPTLLLGLAMDKLRGAAAAVQAEGWSWVDCALDTDSATLRGYGREAQDEREPTAEEAQVIEQLEAEQRAQAQAYDKHQDEGDPDAAEDFELIEQQLCEALDCVEEKLAAARDGLRQWTPEQMRRAGALVWLNHRGEVAIDRGLVRPEDRKAMPSARDDGAAGTTPDTATLARAEFSEKLMRDLTAHRTAAIQAALMQNPRAALVALVHRMVETVFSLYGRGNNVVKVTASVTGDHALSEDASDYGASPAATLLGEAESHWGDSLPGSPKVLFRWQLAQPDATLMEFLAYCTARSFNAVTGRERSFDHSDALVEALGIDMADWWVPSATHYLGSVSKAKALEAVKEATGADCSKAVAGMKKPQAVAYCASKLQGTRWLPKPLRVLAPSEGTTTDIDE